MPDMGFPQEPHDDNAHRWHDAFARLPLEAPHGDGWSRVAARLPMPAVSTSPVPARRRLSRRRRGLAWAAAVGMLALAVAIPLKLSRPADEVVAISPGTPHLAGSDHSTAEDLASPTPAAIAKAVTPAAMPPTAGPVSQRDAVGHEPAAVASTLHEAAIPLPVRTAPTARASQKPAGQVDTFAARAHSAVTNDHTHSGRTAPTSEAFDRLYDESARLELMVALARDEGMSSATTATLAAGLLARIGLIDDSLSRPGLLPDERLDLWQSRVLALRDLAAIEATQRLMASQGINHDAALVRVD